MNHLHTILNLAKIMKVLSAIGKVFCLICAITSVVGIAACCVLYANTDFVNSILLDPALVSYLEEASSFGNTVFTVYASELLVSAEVLLNNLIVLFAVSFISGVVSFVLARESYRYFASLVKSGNPFTYEGADKLKKLGWHEILYSIACFIVCFAVQSILAGILENVFPFSYSYSSIVPAIGIVYLVLALVFRYGAYVEKKSGMSDFTI